MKKTNKSNCILVSVFCLLLAGFFLAFFVTPKADFSEKEKKVLAPAPKFTAQTLADGSFFTGIDSYVSDHFPFREMWVGAAAYGNLLIGRNGAHGVYMGKDGWLIAKPFEKNILQLQKNLMLLRQFCENADAKIFLMPVPSTGYSMQEQLPVSHMAYFDDEIYEIIGSEMAAQAEMVDLRPVLRNGAERGQIYYKTDHHWTSRGAFLAYQTFLQQAMPTAQATESNYTVDKIDNFYGTSYAKSGYWLTGADEIELWKNSSLNRVQVAITDDDTGSTVVKNSVFDMDYASKAKADKYPVFLGGNHSLVKITNPDAATDEKILLVKDSFANSFAPFLAEQYAEVYLVDLRYSRQRMVSDLIEQNGVEQVLFLYSTEDFMTDNNFMWLK